MSLCIVAEHGRGANNEPLHREAEYGHLCVMHRQRMGSVLNDIRDLWTDLAFIVEAGAAPKDDSPRGKRTKASEAPAPANLEVLSLRDPRSAPARINGDQSQPIPSVVATIAGWVMVVAEERPITVTLPANVYGQIGLLVRHGDWIAGQDWVDAFISEMDDLRKALRHTVRDREYRAVGRCPVIGDDGEPCTGKLLERNGADTIKCSVCDACWTTPPERARLSVMLGGAA